MASMEEIRKQWPILVQEAHQKVRATREIAEEHGQDGDKNRLKKLEAGIEAAIGEEDVESLEARLGDLQELGTEVVVRHPDFWIGYLQHLEEQREQMPDQDAADRLFLQAQLSISHKDLDALKDAVAQLIELLPEDEGETTGASSL
jgi:hypothetical protein